MIKKKVTWKFCYTIQPWLPLYIVPHSKTAVKNVETALQIIQTSCNNNLVSKRNCVYNIKYKIVKVIPLKRWGVDHYFVTPSNGLFCFSSKDFQPHPVSILWAATFGFFVGQMIASAWLLVLGSKKKNLFQHRLPVLLASLCQTKRSDASVLVCSGHQIVFMWLTRSPFLWAPPPPPILSTIISSTFCLSSILLRPLQLQHEKAELEQHLEQEQEFQVNKLMKKIKKMENETISKQLTLEQVGHILLWDAKPRQETQFISFPLRDMSFGCSCGLWPGQACLILTIFLILVLCWQDVSLVDPSAAGCLTTWSFLRTFIQNSTLGKVQM